MVLKGKLSYRFFTSAKEYSWLNSTIGVGEGEANPLKGEGSIKIYSWD